MHLILASNRVECRPERFQMQAATGMDQAKAIVEMIVQITRVGLLHERIE